MRGSEAAGQDGLIEILDRTRGNERRVVQVQ